MIMPDYPIEKNDEDKLRRAPLAKKVAELISSFKGKESFVIGIEGVWGSGKTSFINLALKEIIDDKDLIFLKFNPWNFSGQNELISDFFETLIAKIGPFVDDKNKLKKVRSVVSKLTKKSEINFSPEITFWGIGIKAGDWKIGIGSQTLEEERQDIDNLFRNLGKKVVIVIDDLDRLDEDETKLVMKLVKMTANFPNTVFLLAYDRDQVANKLGKEGVGEEYLKKIIQVSFTLPTPDEQGLRKILFADLDTTIEGVYGKFKLEGNDEKRWGELLYKDFQTPFKTIRDIKRFISSLRLNWSIVGKHDVNKIDFIAIEAIRVFAPSLYSGISGNAHLFTNTLRTHMAIGDIGKDRQSKFNDLITALPDNLQKPMRGICEVLFPQLDTANYGYEWEKIWKRELRICASERFGFYFQLGIPEGGISELEITNLSAQFSNREAFKEAVIGLQKDNRLRAMLGKITDRADTFDNIQKKNVILTLWDLDNQISDEKQEMFDFDDIRTQSSRIAYQAIKNTPIEERFDLVEYLGAQVKTFYPWTRFVAMFIDQYKKQDNSEPPLFSQEDAGKLQVLALAKIKKLVSDKKLAEEKQLAFALYRWKDWEGEVPVKAFIKDLISTQKGLLLFLRGCVGRVMSSNGNYNNLDKNGIAGLYPLQEIETLIEKISEKEMEKMKPEDREVIGLFKNPPKDHWN